MVWLSCLGVYWLPSWYRYEVMQLVMSIRLFASDEICRCYGGFSMTRCFCALLNILELLLQVSACCQMHISAAGLDLDFNSQSYYSTYFYIMLVVHYSSNVMAIVTVMSVNLTSFSARALLPCS